MWWKTVVRWLRDRIDVDVDVDLEDGQVQVAVTVAVGEVTVLTEHFAWTVPEPGSGRKLRGRKARRRRVVPGAK